jgi:hypothetical protein
MYLPLDILSLKNLISCTRRLLRSVLEQSATSAALTASTVSLALREELGPGRTAGFGFPGCGTGTLCLGMCSSRLRRKFGVSNVMSMHYRWHERMLEILQLQQQVGIHLGQGPGPRIPLADESNRYGGDRCQ